MFVVMTINDNAQISAALDALEQFQEKVTIPIIRETTSNSYLLGSGVLLGIGGRHFVITAAHLFEGLTGLDELRLPDGRHGEVPTEIGDHKLTISDRDPFDFDTAVIELFDEDKIRRIKAQWQFMDITQIALPTADDIVCLGGFPAQFVGLEGDKNSAKMFVFRTFLRKTAPDRAEYTNLKYDVFGEYDTQADIRNGRATSETPKLQGVSGGSLMQYSPLKPEGGLWSASKTLKFVGVQSSGSDLRKWFRAKNWHAIALTFEKHDPQLSVAIRSHLLRHSSDEGDALTADLATGD